MVCFSTFLLSKSSLYTTVLDPVLKNLPRKLTYCLVLGLHVMQTPISLLKLFQSLSLSPDSVLQFQMGMKDLHSNSKSLRRPANTGAVKFIVCKQFPSEVSPEMDPGIWSRLPAELLEHVLCFLPLKKLLNLRSTCKYFKTLVFTPSFVSKYSSSSSSSFSSFVMVSHPQRHEQLHLYDSVLGEWRRLALSLSTLLPFSSSSTTLLSSSNGLFCFALPSSSFVVCNLVTKSSRVIPFPVYPFAFEHLTLVSTPVGFKIFTLCSGSSSSSAFLYDSVYQSWRQFNGVEPALRENYQQEGAHLNGCLYFATSEPFSIVWFNLEKQEWQRSESGSPEELTFVRPVSDREDKLYLIGGIGSNGISRSLKLWELGDGGDWMELEILPELMCRKFMSVCYHNYEHVYCFYHKGMICICCYMWPEILYYKVSRRTWHWLPKCPSLPEKWTCGFRWFSFVPELHATV